MKIRAFITAGLITLGLVAPCSAFENPADANRAFSRKDGGALANRLIQKVSCNPNDDDKQARCMRACDDAWIKASQAYGANIENAKVEKKACDAKCGC